MSSGRAHLDSDHPRNNLPWRLTSFVGREWMVAEVGAPVVRKTRLASQSVLGLQ
jgi:hypothetical protein